MKKCAICGAEMENEAAFCTNCGCTAEQEEPAEVNEAAAETIDNTCEEAAAETAETSEIAAKAAEDAAGEADEISEEAAEAAEDAACEADEISEEAAEAAEDAAWEAAETSEAAETAGEAAVPSETVSSEGYEMAESFITEGEPNPAKPEKKSRWTWVTTLIVIVTAVVILACAGYLLWMNNGPLHKLWDNVRPKTKSVCVLEDYSKIEIDPASVTVDDETLDSYIYSITGGEELTDELVKTYCESDPDADCSTVEEFRAYIKGYMEDSYLQQAILSALKDRTTVKSYDEIIEPQFIQYSLDNLNYMASSYGVDSSVLASYYGCESPEQYAELDAHESMKTIMIIDKIFKDKKLTLDDAQIDSDLQDYLDANGYSEHYTLESFKETVGEFWVYMFEEFNCKTTMVMDELKDNVVYLDSTDSGNSAETESAAN